VIAVVGAGRSGTSALTRGLAALGVPLGDRLRPGGGKNPTGFFEDEDLLRISRRLKRILGLRGDSLSLIDAGAWRSSGVQALVREACDTVEGRFGAFPIWGFKYGRTLRFLPFWLEVFSGLELAPSFALALRNPLSVARSRARLDPRRGVQERSDLEWLVNVVPYLARLRGHPLAVVDYDLLMADPRGQLARMGRLLELPGAAAAGTALDDYARRFLRAGLRHSRFSPEQLEGAARVHPLARDAYRRLRELARSERAEAPEPFWRDWKSREESLALLAPALRYLDRLDAERRRARRNPLSPLAACTDLWRLIRRTDAYQVRARLWPGWRRRPRSGSPGPR